ncbi:MAG: amidohydrolase family protein [Clostridia bacterium]|nr:amidohydrolase family protein [Clostridia bacterium]
MIDLQKEYGYESSNFLSVEGMDDAAQNALAIYFKLLNPNNYAMGGFHYRFDYDFAKEAKTLYDLGLDGMKMIENKPTERKRLGYAQDDERYDEFYSWAEKNNIPLLFHVNDPAFNWDPDNCPQWARDAGCFYGDGTYVSYEQILQETCNMLDKYPNLNICIAHFFFLSDNEPKIRELMTKHKNLKIDITAGTEMYYEFDAYPDLWRKFFIDFSDRIFFGTDNCYPAGEYDTKIAHEINALERDYLTRNDVFPLWDRTIQGGGYSDVVVQKIAETNFRDFAGQTPRKLNIPACIEYINDRLNNDKFKLCENERKTMEYIAKILGKYLPK